MWYSYLDQHIQAWVMKIQLESLQLKSSSLDHMVFQAGSPNFSLGCVWSSLNHFYTKVLHSLIKESQAGSSYFSPGCVWSSDELLHTKVRHSFIGHSKLDRHIQAWVMQIQLKSPLHGSSSLDHMVIQAGSSYSIPSCVWSSNELFCTEVRHLIIRDSKLDHLNSAWVMYDPDKNYSRQKFFIRSLGVPRWIIIFKLELCISRLNSFFTKVRHSFIRHSNLDQHIQAWVMMIQLESLLHKSS
jgi:hypothetical protein